MELLLCAVWWSVLIFVTWSAMGMMDLNLSDLIFLIKNVEGLVFKSRRSDTFRKIYL